MRTCNYLQVFFLAEPNLVEPRVLEPQARLIAFSILRLNRITPRRRRAALVAALAFIGFIERLLGVHPKNEPSGPNIALPFIFLVYAGMAFSIRHPQPFCVTWPAIVVLAGKVVVGIPVPGNETPVWVVCPGMKP